MKRAIPFLLVLLLIALGYLVFSELYLSEKTMNTTIRIERGESLDGIAQKSTEAGLVSHPLVFRVGARIFRVDRKIKAGFYRFNGPFSLRDILLELTTGRDRMIQVTIPEGLNHLEIFQLLVDHGLGDMNQYLYYFNHPDELEPVRPQPMGTLEGWLYPDTYRFPEYADGKDVLNHLIRQFSETYQGLGVEAESEVDMTPQQVITLASLVEKETGVPEERRLIASVFHNRLEKNMKLDCDPTVIYALILEGKWDGNIRRRDLEMDNPYNTYRRRGLPPGPIANPGREALLAVLKPARTDYYFFVSRNDGTHDFSSTYREHAEKVQRYQVNYWRNKRKSR